MKTHQPHGLAHGPRLGHGLGHARAESFERYYLRQVAMGEGCNCAEQVLSQRDQQPLTSSGIVEALRALFRKRAR